MKTGLFISGTDTGVGKTQVAFGLAAAFQRRLARDSGAEAGSMPERAVRLWKPIQTGVRCGDPEADSYLLKAGSGSLQEESDICTLTLPDPLAPWMAAQRAGVTIDFAGLVEEGCKRIEQGDYVIVEGAGGLAVPITAAKLMIDLAHELKLPLVIVARPGLGTVNHTLLSIAFAKQRGLRVAGVIINGCTNVAEPTVLENAMMIEQFGEVPVIGKLPWFARPLLVGETWNDWQSDWTNAVETHVDLDRLWNFI